MLTAPVNKIIPFSNVDGPGNRCAIFFQSCPFNCLYCHNPETINMCCNCGLCVPLCPSSALSWDNGKVVWDSHKCIDCDTCIKTCPNSASPKIINYSVSELVKKIQEISPFIRGITVSGGECMVHADFLLALFKEVKKLNLTCLIDSNGDYDFAEYPELLAISDGVMLDVKAFDDDFHQKLTGKSNQLVLKNLHYLLKMNKLEEVRTVLLPNHQQQNNYTVSNVSRIIQTKTRYKLLRYRQFGVRDEGLEKIGHFTTSEEIALENQKIALANNALNTVII